MMQVPALARHFRRALKLSGNISASYAPSPAYAYRASRPFSVTQCTRQEEEQEARLPQQQEKKISKAMKAYIEQAKEHENWLNTEKQEYQMGKLHLANIIGADSTVELTEEEIERAIEYLLPSGLYDVKARPSMKSPEHFIPRKKAAQFDESGRPFHSMFYTGKPNFFQLLFQVAGQINKLNALQSRQQSRGATAENAPLASLASGSEWLPKDALEKRMIETITDLEYDNFIAAMNRLLEHALAGKQEEFLRDYRKPLISRNVNQAVAPVEYHDADGRQCIVINECLRKRARGTVEVKYPGTGEIAVNGKSILSLPYTQHREQVLFPLLFSNMTEKVDVVANVEGGGDASKAGAVRWGIAMALRSLLEPAMVARMRTAGLLSRDYRRRERKKPGQAGARRKYTWKKR